MFIVRILMTISLIPFAWISSVRCRNLPFAERYRIIQRWSLRVLHCLGVPVVVEQKGKLPTDTALFFVANHQGTFDPLLLVAGIHTPLTFVSKTENKKIPVIASISKTLELIYFDRKDTGSAVHMLRESARYLKRRQNLLIFPEGTRSRGREMLPMKEGALQPAYLGKAAIVPVTQVNAYDMWNCIKHRQALKLIIHEAIPYADYRSLERKELCSQLQTIIANDSH